MFKIEGFDGEFGVKRAAFFVQTTITKQGSEEGVVNFIIIKENNFDDNDKNTYCVLTIKGNGRVEVVDGNPMPVLRNSELARFLDGVSNLIYNVSSLNSKEILEQYLYSTLPTIAERFTIRVEK